MMTKSPATDTEAGLKRAALLAAVAGMSADAVDSGGTQLALPAVQASLGTTMAQNQWILNITLMMVGPRSTAPTASPPGAAMPAGRNKAPGNRPVIPNKIYPNNAGE